MLVIKGRPGKDLCDPHLGMTRRDVIRVGRAPVLPSNLCSSSIRTTMPTTPTRNPAKARAT